MANSRLDFEDQARVQLYFWQQTLRLQDWLITLQFWPHEALESSVAKTVFSYNQKTATIALRYPEDLGPVEKDWPPGEAGDYDMSLVHELLHLMFRAMECKVDWAEEQACNLLSRSIVQLYRGQGQPRVPHPSPPVVGDYGHPGPDM